MGSGFDQRAGAASAVVGGGCGVHGLPGTRSGWCGGSWRCFATALIGRCVRAEVVVVDPERPLSTAAVFRRLDASLTARDGTNRIFRFISSDLAGPGTAFPILSNDLERPALEEAPDLAARVGLIRGILIREGALMASLSGSGASYFGLFDDPERARKAQSRLVARGVKALRGRTLSFDQYRRLWAQPARVRARGLDQGRSGQHGDHRRQGHPGR